MKKSPHTETNNSQPGEFDLESFLPYRLSLLTNTISQGIANSYRECHDISVTEWRILAVLGRFPGLSASEVVDRTAMDKVTISRAVKNMGDKKLLERNTDSRDRRRQRLFITRGAGEEVLGDVIPRAQRYETALLQSLNKGELQSLLETMMKLQQAAIDLQ